jgi:hypothetical protein
MYAGRHGIIGNEFYEPAWRATYRLGDRKSVEDGRWQGGEPIWVTAERQGMVSAAMFFIGTEAPVQGIQPTYWNRYSHTLPIDDRLRAVLGWLAMPAERRPHVITLYFPMTDDAGHRHGADSPGMNRAIAQVDSALGRLLDGIAASPHGRLVHVIAVSDHGMTTTKGGRVIWTTMRIWTAWWSFRPARWHRSPFEGGVATHGWAPSQSMRGVFVAAGPLIRPAIQFPALDNIHIYPLMTVLLGVEPNRDIDGKLEVLAPVLVPEAIRSRRSHELAEAAR